MEPEPTCPLCGELVSAEQLKLECPLCEAGEGLCGTCRIEHLQTCQVLDDDEMADPGPDGTDELDHPIWEEDGGDEVEG